MTASLAIDGSQGTFFGMLSAAGALGGTAGYYTGSWLNLNGTSLETWTTFGSVGAIGFAASALILPTIPRQVSLEQACGSNTAAFTESWQRALI